MEKLKSRKFWISIAAFLASLGTGIAGLATGNQTVAIVGGICVVVSSAIYAACEAYVDGASLSSSTTQKVITASTDNKEVVQATLVPEVKE